MRHYYRILNLPTVPLKFEQLAFDEAVVRASHCMNPINEEHKDRWFVGPDGQPAQSSGYLRHDMGPDFYPWVQANICSTFIDGGVAFTERPQRHMLGAHTDRTRKYSLLYVLQPGGARVVTRWYQEPGHDVWREGIVHIKDHTKLELLTELEIPVRTWVCINAQCIHSVEGIQTQRIGINISLDQDWFGLDGDPYKEQQ
jgi:hypothetical protein